jgi:hypothetical protein
MVEISIYPHRTIKSTECRPIILLYFFRCWKCCHTQYRVAKGSKISTNLFTISGHLFFGVIKKKSTNMSWNFYLRFVSEEIWIKSFFSVGIRSDAMCLLCTVEAPSGEIAHSIQFVVVERNYFFSKIYSSLSKFDVLFPTYWRRLLQMEDIISHHSLQLISTFF